MKKNLTLSAAGLLMIMNFEGCRLNAYQDKAGVWTIGYGSTYHADGRKVKKGDKLASKDEAVNLLKHTVTYYEHAVRTAVTVELTQNQFDALVSFVFNVGIGNFKASTLLRILNAGDFSGAQAQFLRWTKITDPGTGKKVDYDVLVLRRKKESLYFSK